MPKKRSTIGESPRQRSNPLDKVIPGGLPKKAVLPPTTEPTSATLHISQDLLNKARDAVALTSGQTLDELVSDALTTHIKKLKKKAHKKSR